MKILFGSKDGGEESRVYMYGVESKRIGSVLLLRFEDGSREAYHTHAFNAVSWVLRGALTEEVVVAKVKKFGLGPDKWFHFAETVEQKTLRPSLAPVRTPRERFHKVSSWGRSWVLSLRGPWAKTWTDFDYSHVFTRPKTLTWGRKVVES